MAKPRKSRPKGYTQEILEEAVQLVRTNRMTLYGACKSFKIPLTTLGDKVRGRRAINPKVKFLLTDEEEEKLVHWIKVQAEHSTGCTHSDVRTKAKEILDLRGVKGRRKDGRPGKDWLTHFKKRHPGLSLRSSSAGTPPLPTASLPPAVALPSQTPVTPKSAPTPQSSSAILPTQATLPQTLSTSQATSATTYHSQVATTKLDAISTLLRLSFMYGSTKCEGFLEMLKEGKTSEDTEFREFYRVLVTAGVIEAQSQSIPVSSVPPSRKSFGELSAPPQLQKNKGGTNSKKNSSLTMVINFEKYKNFLKGKEEKLRMENEMKEKRNKDREEAKVRKEQEVRQERAKSEREKKKQEKKKARERKKMEN